MNSPSDTAPAPSQDNAAAPRVAIIGSGPSGCYTAQALRKRLPDVVITVFDALPTPYGLIRHGIAPDHQGAKAVHRQFDRLFAQAGVDFIGNTTIGRDVAVSDLLDAFHAVVFATGLAQDRPLNLQQEPGTRVLGAGQLLRLLNSDPDSSLRGHGTAPLALGSEIALVGTGNVAVDVARLLSKTSGDLDASDIDDDAHRSLLATPISTIHVIGRCDRDSAKWDPSMIKELASVPSVVLRLDGEPYDPTKGVPADFATEVNVHFRQITESITGSGGRTRLTTHESTDPQQQHHFDVDCVIAAIGFDEPVDAQEVCANLEEGNVFRVGGSVSGRLGNLADNRKLAAATAREVADHLTQREPLPAATIPVESLLPPEHITFDGWQRIDAAETLRARPQRCRTKFTTREQLLAAAEHDKPPLSPETT